MKKNNKRKNQKGFTLIELIVVIAILGILAAIAVPRLVGFRQSATDKVIVANEKLINNSIQIYKAAEGDFPTTVTNFTQLIGELETQKYLTSDIADELLLPATWDGTIPTWTNNADSITLAGSGS